MHKSLRRLAGVRLPTHRRPSQCSACLKSTALSREITTVCKSRSQGSNGLAGSTRSAFLPSNQNKRLPISVFCRTIGTTALDNLIDDSVTKDKPDFLLAPEVAPLSLQTVDPKFFDLTIIPPEPIREFRNLYDQIAQSKDTNDHEKFLSVYRSIADDIDLLLQFQPIDFMIAMNSCRDLLHMIPRMHRILQDVSKTSHAQVSEIYNIILKAYSKMSDFKSCSNMIDKMRAQKMGLNTTTYHIILDTCKHARKLKDAQGILAQMRKKGVEVTSATYLILLSICARCKNVRQAREYFEEMPLLGLDRDVAHYNALLNAYAHAGDATGAKRVYQLMEDDGILADQYTYTAMVKAYRTCNRFPEAIHFLKKLREAGVKPNAKVLAAMGEEPLEIVEECARSEVPISQSGFNMLITRAIKSNQFPQVPHLLEEMQKAGHRPDVFTFTAMVDANIKMGKYQEAKEIFMAMQRANIQPDVIAYSAMISGALSQVGVQESMVILKAMMDDGLLPNLHTFNSLLSASVGEIGVEGFKVIREAMQSLHIRPDHRSFNALLSAYALEGDMDEMLDALEDMKRSRVPPDNLTYSILISGYLQNGDLRFAMEWYYKMIESGHVPTTRVANNLMAALHGSGQGQQVLLLWREMDRMNVGKNDQSFEIALEACEKFGLHDDKLRIEKELNIYLSGGRKYYDR
ncbi:hypothetical protein BGZ79_011070 [Entomortierella chlamydospora]|nr:hypothetical protein BGZ79_011070 [Entomortierella chlamydospora]